MGMFQTTASSGNSSSSSSHSASLSLTVFRFESCHDCRLALREGDGKTSMFRELRLERVRGAAEKEWALDGEGDREERFGAESDMVVSEGTEGEVKPLRSCFPGAASCACWRWTAWWTWPCRLGYLGLAEPVRSRKAWGWAWARLRGWEADLEASKMTRLEGLTGSGKEAGPPAASLRLMSSKCERSAGPMRSERVDEWKLDDLLDFEFVRSGGLPGGGAKVAWPS